MTKFDIFLYKSVKWLLLIAIGLVVFLLTGCSKDDKTKPITKTYNISVTGVTHTSQWTVNGQTYYGGNPPTLTISTGQTAHYKDAATGTQKNVAIIVDNNQVWSYSGNGVAEYTYTAN